MLIKIKKILEFASIPKYATPDSAGMDLVATLGGEEVVLFPQGIVIVPCGFGIELPRGFEAQIRSRSGLASKGISVLNSPGTIDCDYRGEIKVILMNHTKEQFVVTDGMKVAQMVVAPYQKIEWLVVDDLSESIRGEGGFGSTGYMEYDLE
ncbi:dUTP diphosphatase [Candidatus Sarmatiella mevalonica]|uniref:dUTP diphosphatase n=1 Tax=Candidatus Sarmatiella mevalonica TaxID=2770581 RepID=UPI001921F88C|nr:dUTP diphosphatase [Candidatus Sarmatiella mevalonica]